MTGQGKAASPVTSACCIRLHPDPDGYRSEGAEWTCPECRKVWVWIEDEAEGGYFTRQDNTERPVS